MKMQNILKDGSGTNGSAVMILEIPTSSNLRIFITTSNTVNV
jgi:hypothetical protein